MSIFTLAALIGLAALGLWVYDAINYERLQIAAETARQQFAGWADATIAQFDDEDDEAFAVRLRAVAAAQAAEVQR